MGMETILTVLAKVIEIAANTAADSTSLVLFYQPEKPECLKKND